MVKLRTELLGSWLNHEISAAHKLITETNPVALPRLLYVSDVVVESSFHGSALLYRLLQGYPPDRLLILQPTAIKSEKCRRLVGVTYADLRFGNHQLLHSRFSQIYRTWLALTAKSRTSAIRQACGEFRPEAVLTVIHGVSWIAAAEFARQERLPLLAIVHDDWPRVVNVLQAVRLHFDRIFGVALRHAKVTFCVSPNMQESYRTKYGARSCLLYPSQPRRASNAPLPMTPAALDKPLTVAFAGTINSDGYAELLRSVASCLATRQGRLLLFGPFSTTALNTWGLNLEAVENRGLIDSDEIASHLAREADVLLVPMSFAEYEKENMRLGFPSKIAEYAATGIPMLILGPEYCSAVRWAREMEPVAEVVSDQSVKSLGEALDRLASRQHREMLGRRALEIGQKLFSHGTAELIFFTALRGASSSRTC
jgi:glycosyltransferase involved in cell wall biosynthesis